MCFPGGSEVKASACNAGDLGLIPGSGRSPGERNGYLLQYFEDFPGGSDGKKKKNLPAVQNSMGRGARELQSVGLQRAGHD